MVDFCQFYVDMFCGRFLVANSIVSDISELYWDKVTLLSCIKHLLCISYELVSEDVPCKVLCC